MDKIDLDGLPEEVRAQLAQLDSAEYNLVLILTAILMQFKTLGIQRDQLIDSAVNPEGFNANDYPDTFSIQVVASIITLCGLLGFYNQAEQTAAQAGTCAAESQADLSFIVIVVALVRYSLLLENNRQLPEAENDIIGAE